MLQPVASLPRLAKRDFMDRDAAILANGTLIRLRKVGTTAIATFRTQSCFAGIVNIGAAVLVNKQGQIVPDQRSCRYLQLANPSVCLDLTGFPGRYLQSQQGQSQLRQTGYRFEVELLCVVHVPSFAAVSDCHVSSGMTACLT